MQRRWLLISVVLVVAGIGGAVGTEAVAGSHRRSPNPDAEEVEDRRVKVVHAHFIGAGLKADLVSRAVMDAAADAAAEEPCRKSVRVVIAARLVGFLRDRKAATIFCVRDSSIVSTRPNWLWSTTGIGGRLAGQAGLAATGATASDATVFELIRRSHR